jgi:transcriptional regulator with XRE-family HTH domain
MAKKRPRGEPVTDQVRRHVLNCGQSCYAIAKATGIDESTLSRFLSGERGISAKALDRLGEYLQFEVVMRGPKD